LTFSLEKGYSTIYTHLIFTHNKSACEGISAMLKTKTSHTNKPSNSPLKPGLEHSVESEETVEDTTDSTQFTTAKQAEITSPLMY
jgi:hypothetical protein